MGSVEDFMPSHGVTWRFPSTVPSPVRFAAFAAISLLPLVARHVDFISPIFPTSISTIIWLKPSRPSLDFPLASQLGKGTHPANFYSDIEWSSATADRNMNAFFGAH
jgi:hypothetical protein